MNHFDSTAQTDPTVDPIKTGFTTIIDPHHPHHNPPEVTAIEVTRERLDNGEIPGVVIDAGFPYLDIPVQKTGVGEFGRNITSTIIDHHFLALGDFIVTEPPQSPNDQTTYVLDADTFALNFEPIADRPGHYRAKTKEAILSTHSSHRLDDVACMSYAFA